MIHNESADIESVRAAQVAISGTRALNMLAMLRITSPELFA